MYCILIMSIVGLGVVIERFLYFKINEKGDYSKIRAEIKQKIEAKEIKAAIIALNENKSAASRVAKDVLAYAYINNIVDVNLLEEKARESGLGQIPNLERNMWILAIVAHATPLLGLLGTVTGMIQAFKAVALHGTGDPAVLANGISQALYTTAGGLIVAIPALIFYNYFNQKSDSSVNLMEKTSTELINLFRK